MRTTHVNKSLPVELGEDIVVKSYKRGSPEAAMPIIDPKPSYLILSYLMGVTLWLQESNVWHNTCSCGA